MAKRARRRSYHFVKGEAVGRRYRRTHKPTSASKVKACKVGHKTHVGHHTVAVVGKMVRNRWGTASLRFYATKCK